MQTSEMVHHISNLEIADLDNAIDALQRARLSRAEVRAAVSFKEGDKVKFPWCSDTGKVTLVGEYDHSRTDPGKVCIRKVMNLDGSISNSSGTHVVDAALVDHVD